jgi:hypothetical protein
MRVWEITYYATDPTTIPPRRIGEPYTITHLGSLREFALGRLREVFVVWAQARGRRQ